MAVGRSVHQIVVMMFSSFYTLTSVQSLLTIIPMGAVFSIMDLPLKPLVAGIISYVVLFAFGFTGLYALVKEDSRKMKIFGILVVISVILILLCLIFCVVIMFIAVRSTENSFKYAMETYNISSSSRKSVDSAQVFFKCCGIDSYSDWGSHVPSSCCKDLDTTETCDAFNEIGCTAAHNKLWISASFIAIPCIFVVAFHIFTAKYSFVLAKEFKYPENKP